MSADRDALIEKWMGLAAWYARHHFTNDTRFDFEERRSVAYLALIKAADGYDPSKGFSFGTYAGKIIYRFLSREAYRQASQIKRRSPSSKCSDPEPVQHSLEGYEEILHSKSHAARIEDHDHVLWILSQLNQQELAVAIGIMQGKKYSEIRLPGIANPSTSSRRSKIAYIKKKMAKKACHREINEVMEYVRRICESSGLPEYADDTQKSSHDRVIEAVVEVVSDDDFDSLLEYVRRKTSDAHLLCEFEDESEDH